MRSCFHSVDDEFVASIENQNNGFKQASIGSKSKPQFSLGIFFVQRFHPLRPAGGMQDIFIRQRLVVTHVFWLSRGGKLSC